MRGAFPFGDPTANLSAPGRLAAAARRLARGAPPAAAVRLAGAVVDGALIAACAYLAASLAWQLIGRLVDRGAAFGNPAPAVEAAADFAEPLTLKSFDMFRGRDVRSLDVPPGQEPALGRAAPATSLDLQLLGVRARAEGGGGSAIMRRPDGSQDVFAVGQAIGGGVTLAAVWPDRVVISRDGILESVPLAQSRLMSAGSENAASPTPAANPEPAALTLERLISAMTLRRGGNGEVVLMPGADPALFAAAGFQAGDRLVHVNGRPVESAEDLPDIIADLAGVGGVVLAIDRGGSPTKITLSAGPGA